MCEETQIVHDMPQSKQNLRIPLSISGKTIFRATCLLPKKEYLRVVSEENIDLGKLFDIFQKMSPPLELMQWEKILNPTPTIKGKRQARNMHQKANWENRCGRTTEMRILWGDKTWKMADRKRSSLLIPSIGKYDFISRN